MQNDITLPNFSVKIGQTKMSLDDDLRDLIEDILFPKTLWNNCGMVYKYIFKHSKILQILRYRR